LLECLKIKCEINVFVFRKLDEFDFGISGLSSGQIEVIGHNPIEFYSPLKST